MCDDKGTLVPRTARLEAVRAGRRYCAASSQRQRDFELFGRYYASGEGANAVRRVRINNMAVALS